MQHGISVCLVRTVDLIEVVDRRHSCETGPMAVVNGRTSVWYFYFIFIFYQQEYSPGGWRFAIFGDYTWLLDSLHTCAERQEI